MDLIFFTKPQDFRKWFQENHGKEQELWVGYYKKASSIPSITWPESVDEALCYGWIDGIRKSIDEVSYMIRFTPRKPRSHWSDVNIGRVKELSKLGLMQPTGTATFNKRDENKSRLASYEQKKVSLDKNYEAQFKATKSAWKFFQTLPPSVKKPCIWWVMSAKREETRMKRLEILIQSSVKGERIPPLKWGEKK